MPGNKAIRILVLSFYYRPDLSAGSFRTTALVDALLAQLPPDAHIDLLTTLPNRYSTFDSSAPELERFAGLTVRRIRLPAHRSGMRDQARAFASYGRQVSWAVRGQRYDLVYATSSRLMTAALGARVARQVRAPLYLDIRDIFADTIGDVLPARVAALAKLAFDRLERWTVSRAAHVNLVSRGFERYFRERYPDASLSFFTNGIDEEFVGLDFTRADDGGQPDALLSVVYAGNIGEGQGLHTIVPEMAARLEGRAVFTIIGDGGRRGQLEAALRERGIGNVMLKPPVARDELIADYRAADVLFLHLNDYPAFRKVLPSKIFEYAATGKPILAGVAGHAAQFLSSEVPNAEVFLPCNADDGVNAFGRLLVGHTPRDEFVRGFSRSAIMAAMVKQMLGLVATQR